MWGEVFWIFLMAAAAGFGFTYGMGLAAALTAAVLELAKRLRRT